MGISGLCISWQPRQQGSVNIYLMVTTRQTAGEVIRQHARGDPFDEGEG